MAALRYQALSWLKAELGAWKRVALTVEPGNRELVARTLSHWKSDSDLVGIRDSDALAKLPESERRQWQALWVNVAALIQGKVVDVNFSKDVFTR